MIIALTGPAGCGKSALAQALVDRHAFVRVRFASPLKAMLRSYGLTEAQVDGDEKEIPCELLGGHTSEQGIAPKWITSSIANDHTIDQAVDALHLLIETTRARGCHGL